MIFDEDNVYKKLRKFIGSKAKVNLHYQKVYKLLP